MIRLLPFFIFLGILITFSCYDNRSQASASAQVKEQYLLNIAKTDSLINKLKKAIQLNLPEHQIQHLFKQTRLAYKRVEFLAEYYSPLTSRFINGPPIPEIDVDDQHRITQPEGFQVIEPFLFPQYNLEDKKLLLKEVDILLSNFKRLKVIADDNPFGDDHIFDAARLEVFRLITLGISGYDAPLAQNSVTEAKASLSAIAEVFQIYHNHHEAASDKTYLRLQSLLHHADDYLRKNASFSSFNRMQFIQDYANPISKLIPQLAYNLHIAPVYGLRAINNNAADLFVPDAFNVNFFAPNLEAHTSKEKAALGKILFFDPVLSGAGNRSCASCHQPQKAFTDGLQKNISVSGNKTIKRNTPTVLNAGLQSALFYDVRVQFLEDQATDVITSNEEMHGSLDTAVSRLKQSLEYQNLFRSAFPKAKETLSEYNLRNALGSYIRSLTSLQSRFDKYMRGDKSQMNQLEIKGFNLYMGKAKCGTCHFAPLFNGVVPPNFNKTESEIIGVPVSVQQKKIDSDAGKYNLRHLPMHKNAFRTPTVRNIALTAPYMHNGIYNTLEEVIDFYNNGGGMGLGIKLENQTLPFDKLNLSGQEKQDIIEFLKSLTDTTKAREIPEVLPALHKSSSKRTIHPLY